MRPNTRRASVVAAVRKVHDARNDRHAASRRCDASGDVGFEERRVDELGSMLLDHFLQAFDSLSSSIGRLHVNDASACRLGARFEHAPGPEHRNREVDAFVREVGCQIDQRLFGATLVETVDDVEKPQAQTAVRSVRSPGATRARGCVERVERVAAASRLRVRARSSISTLRGFGMNASSTKSDGKICVR